MEECGRVSGELRVAHHDTAGLEDCTRVHAPTKLCNLALVERFRERFYATCGYQHTTGGEPTLPVWRPEAGADQQHLSHTVCAYAFCERVFVSQFSVKGKLLKRHVIGISANMF